MSEEATGRTPYRGFAGKPAKSPPSAGEMVERVARALREGGSYEDMARAAIAAMRDLPHGAIAASVIAGRRRPPQSIYAATCDFGDEERRREEWWANERHHAVIDAALKAPTHTTGDE